MNHLILLTHGELSKGIRHSLGFILGEIADVTALSLRMDTSMEESRAMLEGALAACPAGEPVVVATDLPGGSTTQCALSVLPAHDNMYLVSGLNLALLMGLTMLELTGDREADLAALRECVEEAKESLLVVSDVVGSAAAVCDDDEL